MDKFDKRQFQKLQEAKAAKLKPPLEPAGLVHLESVAKLSIPPQLVELLKVGF